MIIKTITGSTAEGQLVLRLQRQDTGEAVDVLVPDIETYRHYTLGHLHHEAARKIAQGVLRAYRQLGWQPATPR